jgi:O-antigen ligase
MTVGVRRPATRRPWGWLAGTALGAATALAPGPTALGLLAGTLGWMAAVNLPLAAGALLAVRSSLDFLTGTGIPVGPVRVNPPGALGVVVAVLAIFHLVDRRLRRVKIDFGGGPALAFALLTAFALIETPNGVIAVGPKMLAIGLKETVRLGSLLGLYLLLVNLMRGGADRRLFLRAIFLAMLVPCAVGLWQFTYYSSQGFYNLRAEELPVGRVSGTFFHPNSFGLFLAVLLTLGFALLRNRRSGIPSALLPPAMALAAFLLAFTASRGSWIFLGVCLFVKVLLRPGRTLVPVVLVALVVGLAAGPRIAGRFSDVRSDVSLRRVVARQELRNSFEWRIYNWYILTQVGLQRPLLGHGTGSTSAVNPLQSVNRLSGESRGFSAHNEFVRYFVEGGLAGLAVILAFFGVLGGWAFRTFRSLRRAGDPDADLAGVAVEVIAGLAVLSVFAANPLDQTGVYYYLLALFAVVHRSSRDRRPLRAGAAAPGLVRGGPPGGRVDTTPVIP